VTPLEQIDKDLVETSRRYERALDQGKFDLADKLESDIDKLLDRRNELTIDS
jgi:hypothetical protein